MEILELNLKHFGKFLDHTVKLKPGINVIYGDNETGKSTIHAFIRAMFFGLDKGRGKREEYFLRLPWENPSYFAGNMRLRYGGEIYRIERNFYRSDRDVRLICESRGRELPADDAAFQELLGGMNEAVFRNTIFIAQSGNETDEGFAEQLRRYMVNFQEAGDGAMDVSDALERLKHQRREIETNRRREQELLDEKISRNQVERDYVKRELEQGAQLQPEVGEERPYPPEQLNGPAEGRGQSPGQNLLSGTMEEWGQGSRKRSLFGRMEEWEQDSRKKRLSGMADEWGQADGRRVRQADIRGFYGTFLRWLNVLLPLCGLLGIGCGIMAGFLVWKIVFLVIGIVFLVLAVLTLNYTWKERSFLLGMPAAYVSSRDQDPDRDNDEFRRTFSGEDGREAERAWQNIGSTPPGSPETSEERLERRLEKRLEGEKQAWKKEEKRRLRKEKDRKLEALDQEMQELLQERELLASYDRELEAVDLAMLRIRELSARIMQEAGTDFNRIASEILSELTEGNYTQIALDEKMQVRINTASKLLHLYQVSQGTMHQIYFAMRMAAGILLTGGAPLPIILDDPFAMYDEEHLEAALRWLKGSGRQVVLFTCHKRELELLKRIEG